MSLRLCSLSVGSEPFKGGGTIQITLCLSWTASSSGETSHPLLSDTDILSPYIYMVRDMMKRISCAASHYVGRNPEYSGALSSVVTLPHSNQHYQGRLMIILSTSSDMEFLDDRGNLATCLWIYSLYRDKGDSSEGSSEGVTGACVAPSYLYYISTYKNGSYV